MNGSEQNGISVIIPNYNGRILLQQTLPALFTALKNVDLPYEIIISDDHSTDDSVIFIKQNFAEIILLESEENLGFSPAINKGIFISRFTHLLLLNSDVKLSENYFFHLFKYFDLPDTFGVMGKIIGWDDDEIQDGGKYPAFHGAKIKTSGNYVPLNYKFDKKLYSMYLSGANAFVSRQKIIDLKGFDELFAPFYVEDFELSLRAWRLGWKCYYEDDAICRHKTSATIKNKNSKRSVNSVYDRNKMFLHAIHLSGLKKAQWYLQLIPETIIRILTFRFEYIRSLKMFISSLNKVARSKREFDKLLKQNNSDHSVSSVVKLITASLSEEQIKKF